MIAKSSRTQCRSKDLADTVAVDPTARLVVTAVHPLAATRPGEAAVAILPAEAHPLAATALPVIRRPVEHRRATAHLSPATAATQAGRPPDLRRRRGDM